MRRSNDWQAPLGIATGVVAWYSLRSYAPDWKIAGGFAALFIFVLAISIPPISAIISSGLIVLLAASVSIYSSAQQLTENSTVYDFKVAAHERQLDYMMGLCRYPRCLTEGDWECGFDVDERQVSDCVHETMIAVEPWEKIGRIVQYCALKVSVTDDSNGSKEACARLGRRF